LVRTFSAPQMSKPNDIAIDGDILYVANTDGRNLMAFDVSSGELIFNFDCRELYGGIRWHSVGPMEVYVTQKSIVLGGSGAEFHFFEKGRRALHQKSLPFPMQDPIRHKIIGEFIYVLPAQEFDWVCVFDLDGKLVRKLHVVFDGQIKHSHKEKRQFLLADGRFYLFEREKLLMGDFPDDFTNLVVQRITDWDYESYCYDIASEDEMYCRLLSGRKNQVICMTNTGQITQWFSMSKDDFHSVSYLSFSPQGLCVSDWGAGKVYLFQ
jgi:hypothetical protein